MLSQNGYHHCDIRSSFQESNFVQRHSYPRLANTKGGLGAKKNPPVPQGTKSLGHGDNSEFSEIFGRTIPNAILPFSCSSHHDSLRSSQNFENLSIVKKYPSSELSFFALYMKTIT